MQHFRLARLTARLVLVLPIACAAGAVFVTPPAHAMPADPEPTRVTLPTEDKHSLVATYYAPRDSKQMAPGAVLVHDAGGSRGDLEQLATRLQKSGFAVLALDLRGHGDSATEALDWKKLDTDGQLRTWAFTTRDVKAGVEFLTSQKGVHSTTVSLVGHGAGCTLVARHATRDVKVRDLVLLSPRAEQLGYTLVRDLQEIAGLPVFIAAGKDEANTAKRICEVAQRGASGSESIETKLLKVDATDLLADNKLPVELARWMHTKALPGAAAAISAGSSRSGQ